MKDKSTHHPRQINLITNILKQTLRHDESSGEWFPRLLLHDTFQDTLQIIHIIMSIPSDGAARDLNTLSSSIIDSFIDDDEITTFREGRDDA